MNNKKKYTPKEESNQKRSNVLKNRNDISGIIELPARIQPTVIKITRGFYNKENIISKTATKLYNDICSEKNEYKEESKT